MIKENLRLISVRLRRLTPRLRRLTPRWMRLTQRTETMKEDFWYICSFVSIFRATHYSELGTNLPICPDNVRAVSTVRLPFIFTTVLCSVRVEHVYRRP